MTMTNGHRRSQDHPHVPVQGRTGFGPFFALSAVLLIIYTSATLGDIYFGWGLPGTVRALCAALGVIGALGGVAVERMSRPPPDGPAQYVAKMRREKAGGVPSRTRSRVLVCLGDSLTHGVVSDDWAGRIASDKRIEAAAAKAGDSPLEVVKAAQNSICTHTVLKERVYHVQACRPDYVFVLVGSNDMMSVYREDWARDKIWMWNLPERPTMEIFEKNLGGIVQHLLEHTEAKIGLCTLPPMGEDFAAPCNGIVRQANVVVNRIAAQHKASKRVAVLDAYGKLKAEIISKRAGAGAEQKIYSADDFLIASAVMNILHHLLGVSWNALSRTITGNKVTSDSIHLNDDGGNVMVNLTVEWLLENGMSSLSSQH